MVVSRWNFYCSLSNQLLGDFPSMLMMGGGCLSAKCSLFLTSAWRVTTMSHTVSPHYRIPAGQESTKTKMIFNDLCAVFHRARGSIPAQEPTAADLELNIDSSHSTMSQKIKVAVSIFHLKTTIYMKGMFHFTALWCWIFTDCVLWRVWMLFSVSTCCVQLREGTVVCQSSKSGWTIPNMIATITTIALEYCTNIHTDDPELFDQHHYEIHIYVLAEMFS